MSDKPVITKGAFDSQNLAFWDAVRGEYREYHRDFRDGRDIRTCTSKDFLTWTEPVFLEYTPGRVSELYTNGIAPYYRAPHLFLGFPTRYIDRGWTEAVKALPRYDYRLIRGAKSPREGTAVTDGMFMTSRDGLRFQVWPESFIRPDCARPTAGSTATTTRTGDWSKRNRRLPTRRRRCRSTSPRSTMQDRTAYLRRYTLRIDGFVSVIRAAGRRRSRHQTAALPRQPPAVELLDVGRRQHPHRNPGRGRHADPRFRAGRRPGALRRLAGASRAVERGLETRLLAGTARAAALRPEGRRPVFVPVSAGRRMIREQSTGVTGKREKCLNAPKNRIESSAA